MSKKGIRPYDEGLSDLTNDNMVEGFSWDTVQILNDKDVYKRQEYDDGYDDEEYDENDDYDEDDEEDNYNGGRRGNSCLLYTSRCV